MATDYTTSEIECPGCGVKARHEIEYMVGTGLIPRNFIECSGCRKELKVEAYLKIDVEVSAAT